MEPHDKARGVELRNSSAVPSEELGHPVSAPATAAAAAGSAAASTRPAGVSSFVPDAFCCLHPLALEQRQQQGSGDWHLRATSKSVRSEADLRRWLSSPTHTQFLSFVGRLARHAAGKKTLPSLLYVKNSNNKPQIPSAGAASMAAGAAATTTTAASAADAAQVSVQSGARELLSGFVPFSELPANRACWALVEVLQQLLKWVDEIPPLEQPTRFGNQAFKTWCRRLEEVRWLGVHTPQHDLLRLCYGPHSTF